MLVQLIVGLVVLGIILWAINQYIPMDDKIKMLLNVAVFIVALLWVLQAMGLLGPMREIGVR